MDQPTTNRSSAIKEHPLIAQLRKLLTPVRWTRRKYKKYLRSPWWQKKRVEKLISQSYKCERCGEQATEVHHKHYNSIGHEANDDLVAICNPCHKKEHGIKPRKRKKKR